jgi:hypothetical protein
LLKLSGFNPEGNMSQASSSGLHEAETVGKQLWAQNGKLFTPDFLAREVRSYDKARELEQIGRVSWNPFYPEEFCITSENGENVYHVTLESDLFSSKCTCKDYLFRGRPCKHVGAAALFVRRLAKIDARQEITRAVLERTDSGSEELVPAEHFPRPGAPLAVLKAASLTHSSLQSGRAVGETSSCWDMLRLKKSLIDSTKETSAASTELPAENRRNKVPEKTTTKSKRGTKEEETEGETEQALNESIRELQAEMKALRLDLQQPKVVQVVPDRPQVEGNSAAQFYLSAEQVHDATIGKLKETKSGGEVILMAYSFDRRDVGEELLRAHKRGCNVQVLVDARQTLGGPKEQFAVIQELIAQGLSIKVISGQVLGPEYEKAGRGRNFGNLKGVQHSKLVGVRTSPDCMWWFCLGSANWTTSSRCNHEISVGLFLKDNDEELAKVTSHFKGLWSAGSTVSDEDVRTAQRTRSQSPCR